MKRSMKLKTMWVILLSLFFSACDNQLHVEMPGGPQGPAGLSAYELWIEGVTSGIIDWPKDRVQIEHFYLYMKGKDGADGKSAYEIWVEEVGKGLDDPHSPGTQWDKTKTEMYHFWYYLTGADGKNGSTPVIGENGNWWIEGEDTGLPSKGKDGQDGQNGKDGSVVTIVNGYWYIDGTDTGIPAFGKDGSDGADGADGTNGTNGKSAYELWKEAVAKGLLNPHDENGGNWPLNEITVEDFWRYLRGKDGKNGDDGKPGDPGVPGENIIIEKGKFNVIVNYVKQDFNELVRWEDGSATYTVYDKEGNKAPNATVTGLPGVADPAKVYTADADAIFSIPKEDLPVDKLNAGTATVTYNGETETSAANVFVPAKIDVRIRIATKPMMDGVNTSINVIVERRLNTSRPWEAIPSYLGDLNQAINYIDTNGNTIISSVDINIKYQGWKKVARPIKKNQYLTPDNNEWDGADHYVKLQFSSYYGESPESSELVKLAPIQYMPIVTQLKRGEIKTDSNGNNYMECLDGKFDITGIPIDYNLIYKKYYTLSGNIYEPVVENPTTVNKTECLGIVFYYTNPIGGTNASGNDGSASIDDPDFRCNLPYLLSWVELTCKNHYFADHKEGKVLKEDELLLSTSGSDLSIPIAH